MWYKTYVSCMYAKIPISINVGNIILNISSRMTYIQIRNLGNGTRFRIPWLTLTFFVYTILIHTSLGPKVELQRLNFIFP